MIVERGIAIDIPAGCSAVKFDGLDHGLSHCMKAVDFLVETPRSLLFIEIKDPDSAPERGRNEYLNRFYSGSLDQELKYKFRDSWLYLYGLDKISKPIQFLVLMCISDISAESLLRRSDALKHSLPFEGPTGPWAKPLLRGCMIANIDRWNSVFPEFRARRVET